MVTCCASLQLLFNWLYSFVLRLTFKVSYIPFLGSKVKVVLCLDWLVVAPSFFPPLGEAFPSFGVVRPGRVTCTFRNMRYLCTAFYAPRGMRPRGGVEWNGLSRGVMVAQQVLVLFVKVRILARQHKEKKYYLCTVKATNQYWCGSSAG